MGVGRVTTETPVIDYVPHGFQKQVHLSKATNRVIVAGRQSGKTVAAIAEESNWAMSAPARWPDAKDREPQFWWTTASYRTKGKAWRDFGHHVPAEIIRKKHESEAWFELWNGSRITMRSADGKDSLVSERLHGLVADEFAQYDPTVWHQLLAPMLATTGGPVIFSGTPRGHNWAYELYQNARRGLDGWSSHHWTVYDSPYVTPLWIEQRKLETPERLWQQEYLAEFLTDGGEVFRNIDAAIADAAQPDDYTVVGLDLARTHDWTALMAFNSKAEWVASRRVGHLDWSVQRPAIVELYRRVKAKKILVDVTGMHVGADAVVRDLQQSGLTVEPVNIGSSVKRALIEGLMLRFDVNGIRIPMDAAEEFREYSVTQLDSGYDRYSAPSGKHDDYVMAAALGIWGLRHLVGRMPGDKPKSELQLEIEREMRSRTPGNWEAEEKSW